MTATAARVAVPPRVPTPGRAPRAAARSGGLRLVDLAPAALTTRRAPFVALVAGLLAAGLLVLLGLNTYLAQDAFTLHTLQVDGKALADREQALRTAVDGLQAPAALAAQASSLGMVPGGAPHFLRLPDGAVLGSGGPATAPTSSGPAPAADVPAAGAPAVDVPAADVPAGGTR